MRPPIGVEALRIPGTGSSSTVIDSSGPTCPGTQAPPTPFIPSVMLILMPDAESVTVVASPDGLGSRWTVLLTGVWKVNAPRADSSVFQPAALACGWSWPGAGPGLGQVLRGRRGAAT